MRKADYQTLADVIREERNQRIAAGETRAQLALRNVAIEFAKRASVDKAAFLKACGIE